MFPQVVLISTVIGSLIFSKVLSQRVRDFLVPWTLAYYVLVVTVIGSVGESGLFHFVFTVFNFVPVMIVCNGLKSSESRNNPAWKAFLVFYAYMCLVGFTGLFPIGGVTEYLQVLLNTFCMGFFAARWICRTDSGLRKFLFPLLLVGFVFSGYFAIHHGALTSELDQANRIDVLVEDVEGDRILNQNGIALHLCVILPFVVLGVVYLGRRYKVAKIASIACLLVLGLLLVRTGSRNGALALLPTAWYFLHFSANRRELFKRVAVLSVLGLAFVVGVIMTNRGVAFLRAFDFKDREASYYYGSSIDAISTGRWSMYMQNIDRMNPLQKIFGAGCALSQYTAHGEKIDRYRGGNAHSIYMTIFYRTGFVGLILFAIFVITFFRQAKRVGVRGNVAKFLFLMWLLTGVGESWGIIGGALGILAGMGVGLISLIPARNPEFGEMMAFQEAGLGTRYRP